MAITYSWKVTTLKVKNIGDDRKNAVVQVYWEKIGTDENGKSGVFYGATSFTADLGDNSGPFIPFEDLTDQDVISWIKKVVVGDYETHVNNKILEKINLSI